MNWLKKSLLFRFFAGIITLYRLSFINKVFTGIGNLYRSSATCSMLGRYIYRKPYFESSALKRILDGIWAFFQRIADVLYHRIEVLVEGSIIAGFLYGSFLEIKNNWLQGGLLCVGSFGLVYSFLSLVKGRHSIHYIAAGLVIGAICLVLSTVKKERLLEVIYHSIVVRFFLYMIRD